jgi:hypothetical protein
LRYYIQNAKGVHLKNFKLKAVRKHILSEINKCNVNWWKRRRPLPAKEMAGKCWSRNDRVNSVFKSLEQSYSV